MALVGICSLQVLSQSVSEATTTTTITNETLATYSNAFLSTATSSGSIGNWSDVNETEANATLSASTESETAQTYEFPALSNLTVDFLNYNSTEGIYGGETETTFILNGAADSVFVPTAIATWNFDNEQDSENLTHDTSLRCAENASNCNKGNVAGATWTDSGRYGGAYNFDGVDDYIFSNNISSANINNISGTLMAWFYRISTVQEGIVFYDGSHRPLIFLKDDGDIQAHWDAASGFPIVGLYTNQYPTDINTWNNVVFVWKDNTYWFYLNGVLLETYSNITLPNQAASEFYIGQYADSWYFNGTIDEVRIYNRSLTATEIANLYTGSPYYDSPAEGNWTVNISQATPSGIVTTSTNQINIDKSNTITATLNHINLDQGSDRIYNDTVNLTRNTDYMITTAGIVTIPNQSQSYTADYNYWPGSQLTGVGAMIVTNFPLFFAILILIGVVGALKAYLR